MAATVMLATSTFSILRGQVTDAYGDPKDTETTVRTGVPGMVQELRSLVTTTSDGRPQQVRYLVGRLPAGTDVRPDDRLRDEVSGTVYIVDAIGRNTSPIMDPSLRLDLRRVT